MSSTSCRVPNQMPQQHVQNQKSSVLYPVWLREVVLMLQAASFLSQQPDLSFDIPEPARQESWLLTTYLDEVSAARGVLWTPFEPP